MNRHDLGMYLMIWLVTSALLWLLDLSFDLSVKSKILVPTGITVFMILFRISVYLMVGV